MIFADFFVTAPITADATGYGVIRQIDLLKHFPEHHMGVHVFGINKKLIVGEAKRLAGLVMTSLAQQEFGKGQIGRGVVGMGFFQLVQTSFGPHQVLHFQGRLGQQRQGLGMIWFHVQCFLSAGQGLVPCAMIGPNAFFQSNTQIIPCLVIVRLDFDGFFKSAYRFGMAALMIAAFT